MSDNDKSLFLEAMKDVQPISAKTKQQDYNQDKTQAQRNQLIRNVKRRHNLGQDYQSEQASLDHNIDSSPVGSFETITHQQTGLRPRDFEKLKKGNFQVQAELDLHGFTQDSASQKVMNFIEQSYHYQLRFIRIIHGKGYNSEEQFPVLKNLVNQLLRQNRAVLAFHSAPVKDGGVGAVNILLKAH